MPDQTDVDAINDAIVDSAQQPSRVRFGNREVEQQSVDDQIKAANYAASQVASRVNNLFGLRRTILVPPGCG